MVQWRDEESARTSIPSREELVKPSRPDSNIFTSVTSVVERRCVIMRIEGDTDTGKSTLALTAPGPVCYLDSLDKATFVLAKEKERNPTKEIHLSSFAAAVATGDVEAAKAVAGDCVKRAELAVKNALGWAKSIIIDKENELWMYIRLATLGTLDREELDKEDKKKGQLAYVIPNFKYNWFYKVVREAGYLANRPNLILVSDLEDEWVPNPDRPNQSAKSGRRVAKGYKEAEVMADVVIRTKRGIDGVFSAEIKKPWGNEGMRGMELFRSDLDFSTIMGYITSMDPKEWQ